MPHPQEILPLKDQPDDDHQMPVSAELIDYANQIAELDSGKRLQIAAEEVAHEAGVTVVARLAEPHLIERELAKSPESRGWALLNRAEHPEDISMAARLMADLQLVKESLRHSYRVGGRDYSQELQRHEAELYEHYDPKLFQVALEYKRQEIAGYNVAAVPGGEQAKTELLQQLESLADPDVPVQALIEAAKPDPQTMEAIHDWLEDQFGDALAYVDEMAIQKQLKPGEKFNHDDIAQAFRMAIDSTPYLSDTGWQVDVIQRQKTAISVQASEHKVIVPVGRQVTPMQLKKLMIHEVYGHALRSAEAEHAGDYIGQFGTTTYSRFEESFEVVLEQCLEGKYDQKRGVDYYVAIGMALGRTDVAGEAKQPLAKDEVYRIFKAAAALKTMDKRQRPLTDDENTAAATAALKHYRRIFAGMPNTQEGTVHIKDINYFAGRMDAWQLLEAIVKADQVDAGMRWLLSAKMNPFDDGDRKVVGAVPMPSSIRTLVDARAAARHAQAAA